jgi:MFS family permease
MGEMDLSEGLLDRRADGGENASTLLRSYYSMCVCFSLNLSCATTVISFASSDFPEFGNMSTGTLFGAYCLTAIFFANPILSAMSSKRCLVAGTAQYVVYLLTYVLAQITGAGFLTVIGAAVGGVASGYLWVAKGSYFTETTKRYAAMTAAADATEEEATANREQISSKLSSEFATCFLCTEVAFKIMAALIKQYGGEGADADAGTTVMYIVLLIVCVLSALGMTRISPLQSDQEAADEASAVPFMDKVLLKSQAAFALLFSDPKMALMLPFEFSFGLCGAFLNGYISPNVLVCLERDVLDATVCLKPVLPGYYIGYFAAMVSATAAITSTASAAFIKSSGMKWPVMLVGSACFAMLAFLFTVSSDESLSSTGTLVLLYVLQGMGRGVFESCNQGVISDFFPNDAPAAFANVVWSSGGATAFGYLFLVAQDRGVQAWTGFLLSIGGFVGYFAASGIKARGKRHHSKDYGSADLAGS